VTFQASLPTFAFIFEFNLPLRGVAFPAALLTSRVGGLVDDSLDGVNFPAFLLTFASGYWFNQPLLALGSQLLWRRLWLEASSLNRWRA
jgi:hypothetical protein